MPLSRSENRFPHEDRRDPRRGGLAAAAAIIANGGECGTAQAGFPALSGRYLGQKGPGPTPEIFAPGILSLGFHEHNIAVSPDGQEIFFVAASPDLSRYLIMTTRLEKGAWTMPEAGPFSGGRNDGAPAFSPDGQRLYFSSRRPRPAGGLPGEDFDSWYVERKNGSWTDPVNMGGPVNTGQNEVNPSVMSDGTIVFQRIEKRGGEDHRRAQAERIDLGRPRVKELTESPLFTYELRRQR